MRTRILCAATVLALATLVPRAARAYEVRTTASGKDVAWTSSRVDLAVDPSLVHAVYASMDAVNDSAKAWRAVTIAPPIAVTRASGEDQIGALGRNVVFFAEGGYAPAGRALAITVLSYAEDTGDILDADVVVNGAFPFAVLDPHARPSEASQEIANDAEPGGAPFIERDVSTGTFDLTHVIAHELGHVLGLKDEPKDDHALMFRYTSASDASHRAPSVDDVQGIATIYKSGAVRGCAVVSSRGAGFASACALVLLVAFARRRRALLAVAAAGCLLLAAPRVAHGDDPPAHALARVVRADTDARASVWSTRVAFAIEECRIARCPAPQEIVVWGGTRGGVVQQVGEAPTLAVGSAVELDFDRAGGLPRAIRAPVR